MYILSQDKQLVIEPKLLRIDRLINAIYARAFEGGEDRIGQYHNLKAAELVLSKIFYSKECIFVMPQKEEIESIPCTNDPDWHGECSEAGVAL